MALEVIIYLLACSSDKLRYYVVCNDEEEAKKQKKELQNLLWKVEIVELLQNSKETAWYQMWGG